MFFFLLVGMSNVAAQKEIKEGKVSLEITKIETSDEAMQAMLGMMKGSTVTVNFTDQKSLMEMNMMNGMVKMTTLNDKANNKTTMIMDAMGQKKMAEDEMPKEAEKPSPEDFKVTYDKSDTKKILDYTCHRADIVTKNNGTEVKMTAYVTEEIKINAGLMQNVNADQLKGVPLEYAIAVNQQGVSFSMIFVAQEILDYVDEDIFNLKTEGIEKVSMEQLLQGGGMGF